MMVNTQQSPSYQNYLQQEISPHYRSPTTIQNPGYKQQVFTPMSVDSKLTPPIGSLFGNAPGGGQQQKFNGKK